MHSGLKNMGKSALVICAIMVTGCVGAHRVAEQEIEVRTTQFPLTMSEAVLSANELSEEYLRLSGEASAGQDAVALGIISAAATAAGGGFFDSHLDLILSAGLAAGTINEVSNYLKPAEASGYLLTSSEQMTCIIQKAAPYVIGYQKSPEAIGIVQSGVFQVRINLRKKLARQSPNYGELIERFKSSVEKEEVAKVLKASEAAKDLNQLRTEIATCPLLGE